MQDSFEYSGLWWLPKDPEKKVHGKLTYDARKGTALSLDGGFTENILKIDEGTFYEIILGDSYGKKITLNNCMRTRLQFSIASTSNSKQYVRTEFVISIFYVGCHFAKKEDIKFSRTFARFSQLEEWLREGLFKYETGRTADGLAEHTLKLTLPIDQKIVLDKLKISIAHGFSVSIGDPLKPKLEARIGISIETNDEVHIDEVFRLVYHIRNFLSLATGNAILLLTLSGENKSVEEGRGIDIFYRRETAGRELFSYPFPISYDSVSKDLKMYLGNWFNMAEEVKPMYDLFFGTFYNLHLYPYHEFLSLTQALESYLSRTMDNKIVPNENFAELEKSMMKIVDEFAGKYAADGIGGKYKQQLEPKIEHEINRKSFRIKLKEFFVKNSSLTSFISDEEGFIGKVVDTRNYYTHYPEELEKRAAKMQDLPFLSENLRFILTAILLRETGFADKLVEQALGKYMQFRINRTVS